MANPVDLARFDVLVRESGLSDTELARRLGVSQPTVSRLRHGKIANMAGHLDRLEGLFGRQSGSEAMSDERLVVELVALSARLPGLRRTLMALLDLMRKPA